MSRPDFPIASDPSHYTWKLTVAGFTGEFQSLNGDYLFAPEGSGPGELHWGLTFPASAGFSAWKLSLTPGRAKKSDVRLALSGKSEAQGPVWTASVAVDVNQ